SDLRGDTSTEASPTDGIQCRDCDAVGRRTAWRWPCSAWVPRALSDPRPHLSVARDSVSLAPGLGVCTILVRTSRTDQGFAPPQNISSDGPRRGGQPPRLDIDQQLQLERLHLEELLQPELAQLPAV